jgi:hypothetical protein
VADLRKTSRAGGPDWPRIATQKRGFVAGPSDFAQSNRTLWNGAGVFRPGGAAHPSEAAMMGPGARLSSERRKAATELPEAVFCGRYRAHFGHFLAESIGRLWAVGPLGPEVPLLWFADPRDRIGDDRTGRQFLALMGIANPVIVVTEAAQVARLHLAPCLNDPLFRIPASPEFQSWIGARIAGRVAPAPAGDLYLSRSALGDVAGRYLGEAILEDGLRAEGYRIVHPETLSLADQVAAYLGARRIVMAEGSPIHLLALLDLPGQEIAMILRRPKVVHNLSATLASLRRARFRMIQRTAGTWINPRRPSILHRAISRLDMAAVWADLAAAGLIGSAAGKPVPDEAALEAELRSRAGNRTRAIGGPGP